MYKGSIILEAPMLYAIAFLFLFAIGGLTGLFLGALAVDVHLHDTYFVVAHFHYVMMGGTVMAFLAGLHYWWPKMFGRMYSEKLGTPRPRVIFVGFNVTFLTQFVLGSRGMPRRYYNYLAQFQPLHVFSTVGSWILAPAFSSWRDTSGRRCGRRRMRPRIPGAPPAWNGRLHRRRPMHNFEHVPIVTHGPYDYSTVR